MLNKALQVGQNRGVEMGEHFNQVVEMVKLGSGSFRKVENWHLSRMACLIIIAVGYRVNSYKATQFRIWATSPDTRPRIYLGLRQGSKELERAGSI